MSSTDQTQMQKQQHAQDPAQSTDHVTNTPSVLVSLTAADGYKIQATRTAPTGKPKGHLILAGATGVPQRFYQRFATYCAAQGIEVWTLDYRGIGLSKPEDLRGFEMNYLDWARQDLAALLTHVATLTSGPIWMVGHSYGGHAFGLLPGHQRVSRFATICHWCRLARMDATSREIARLGHVASLRPTDRACQRLFGLEPARHG